MYVPAQFDESRPERLHALITAHPLGMLVTHGPAGLDANHLPFDLEVREGMPDVLHAHVARANPVWRDIGPDDEVLVVFRGADAYVSPKWYPSKLETHRQVPTWNYSVVHVYGRVTVHDDARHARAVVARLTKHFEATQPRPWKMGESPEAFISELLTAIVPIEVTVTRLVGKFKLGQNREPRDAEGAARALREQGDVEIGDAMLAALAEREPKGDR